MSHLGDVKSESADDGPFVHACYCGKWGFFGYDVMLMKGRTGTWFCAEHRPADEAGLEPLNSRGYSNTISPVRQGYCRCQGGLQRAPPRRTRNQANERADDQRRWPQPKPNPRDLRNELTCRDVEPLAASEGSLDTLFNGDNPYVVRALP